MWTAVCGLIGSKQIYNYIGHVWVTIPCLASSKEYSSFSVLMDGIGHNPRYNVPPSHSGIKSQLVLGLWAEVDLVVSFCCLLSTKPLLSYTPSSTYDNLWVSWSIACIKVCSNDCAYLLPKPIALTVHSLTSELTLLRTAGLSKYDSTSTFAHTASSNF